MGEVGDNRMDDAALEITGLLEKVEVIGFTALNNNTITIALSPTGQTFHRGMNSKKVRLTGRTADDGGESRLLLVCSLFATGLLHFVALSFCRA
jgi:hypothetical protein